MFWSAEVTNTGVNTCFLDGRVQPGAHFFVGQPALGEELLHQRVVRLGDVLDELTVHLLHPLGQGAGGGRFGVLAALVSRVGEDFTAHHVQHLVEAGAGVDWHHQREHPLAEVLAHLRQGLLEIRLFLVKRVEDDHLRNAVVRRAFPDRVRAHARAVVGVDDDHGEVAHAQRAEALADEIRVTGAIENVELLAQPIQVHEGGQHGDLAVLLALMVVGHRGAGGDGAHAVDHARGGQHGLAEHGFSGRSVAYDGKVTNVTRLIFFHKNH